MDKTSGTGAPRSSSTIDLHQALDVRGVALAGNTAFKVKVETQAGTDHIIVPVGDLDRLVSLLLLLGLSPGVRGRDIDATNIADLPLIPASSLSVGALPTDEVLLLVEVGASTLGFSMPPDAARTLGQSLMLAGTSEMSRA